MALILFANNASTTLAGGISSSATSANLASGTGALFPNPTGGAYFVMTFQDAATGLVREIVWVTARSTDTITIVRAQEGTTAVSWLAGDTAANWWTAGSAAQMVQLGALQQQTPDYAVDSGSVNALAITLTPNPGSLASLVGAPIRVKVAHTNTATSTLNVNALGATQILNAAGSVMWANQLQAGGIVELIYDGTNFYLNSSPYELLQSPNTWGGTQTFSAAVVANVGVQASLGPNGGQFRAYNTNYSAMLHNDGSNVYLLQTGNGTPLGAFNNYRPFFWNLSTGAVTVDSTGVGTTFGGSVAMGSGLNVGGTIYGNEGIIAAGGFSTPGSIVASGNISATGTLSSTGALTTASTLGVSSNTTIGGGLSVGTGIATSSGNVVANTGRLRAAFGTSGDTDTFVAPLLGDFGSSLAGDGYQAIPSVGTPGGVPMILQWFTVGLPGNSSIGTYNFPQPFQNDCIFIIISYQQAIPPSTGAVGAAAISRAQYEATNTAPGGSNGCNVLAIGY